jgi:hypothetical protein
VNVKKLVQLSVSVTTLAFVAVLSACAGGGVDQASCASVKLGDTRTDVNAKLGTTYTETKGTNGSFITVTYEDVPGGVKQCCTVTFDSAAETGIATTQPSFNAACR